MNKITLCGSTKFKNAFLDYNKKLTLEGNVVYSVSCFGHSGDDISDGDKLILDKVHLEKITLSDEIFVLNVNNYIGFSTANEILHAKKSGKKIRYLTDENKEHFKYGIETFPKCKATGKCTSMCALCYE